MLSDYYVMLDISRIRNATAHNNCILNDISKNSMHKPSYDVLRALSHFMKKDVYDGKIANTRIRQITSLLYFHQLLITSGTHAYQSERLHRVVDIMYKNIHFYKNNARLLSVFEYFKKLVDNWH